MSSSEDWIDTTDDGLLTQSADFTAPIVASASTYYVPASEATGLEDDQEAYAAAHAVAKNPSTKTKPNVAIKNQKKRALIKRMRYLGQMIAANPLIDESLKIALSLRPRDTEPTPIGVPSAAPALTALGVFGKNVRCRATDPTQAGKRRRPHGVAGAKIYSFSGEEPPASLDGYKFEGLTTRSDFDVVFGADVAPGAKVWIVACWYNPRGLSGPVSAPVTAYVGGGVSADAA
jgi:hypothetical protein